MASLKKAALLFNLLFVFGVALSVDRRLPSYISPKNGDQLDKDQTGEHQSIFSSSSIRQLRAEPASVIYFAADLSSAANATAIKTATKLLLAILPWSKEFAVSSFTGEDTGAGAYLKEHLSPTLIGSNPNSIIEAIDSLAGSAASKRNVGAALRDAIAKLALYKDKGGSVLYLITAVGSDSTVLELDIIEGLLTNNIQLVAVEVGTGSQPALNRLASLSKAAYFGPTSMENPNIVKDVNFVLSTFAEEPLIIDRQIVFSSKIDVTSGTSSDGVFEVPFDLGTETVVALHSQTQGSFKVTIQSPGESEFNLENTPSSTNWNVPGSDVGLATTTVSEESGSWRFRIDYDRSTCSPSCETTVQVTLQVTSSASGVPATTDSPSTTSNPITTTTGASTTSNPIVTTTDAPTTSTSSSLSSSALTSILFIPLCWAIIRYL